MKTTIRGITYDEVARKYRVAISIDGKNYQLYFKDWDKAVKKHAMLSKKRDAKRVAGAFHTKKRTGAKYPELPPGFHITERWVPKATKDPVFARRVGTVISIDGVLVKTFSAAFGNTRTMKQALAIVKKKRMDFMEKHGLI